MNKLAILHCSDLHFGEVPINNSFSTVWPSRDQNAHDWQLCLAMRQALQDVHDLTGLDDDEEVKIVVSGDLTRTGSTKEFLVGHTFLRSLYRMQRPTQDVADFDVRDSHQADNIPLRVIPGNHDHWWGSRLMWGYNPHVQNSQFRKTPWVLPWQAGELALELCGLDSCAGIDAKTRNLRQVGRLDLSKNGEVAQLREKLKQNDQAGLPEGVTVRVRALIVHHSLAYTGGLMGAGILDDDSRRELLTLAEECHITAFLTGHTHDFFFDPPFDTLPSKLRKVWELRSASTLQGPATRRHPERPGFWAHQIWLDGRQVQWTSWRYYWDGSSSFQPWDRTKPCVDFQVP